MGFTFAQNGQPFIAVIASAICGLCAVWLLALQQQFVNGCMRTITPVGSGTANETTSASTFAETTIATTPTSTLTETAIATTPTSTLTEATIVTTPTSTLAETEIATTSTSTFAETTTTTPTMTMNEACNSCTAALIVDRTHGDIPALANPCPQATPCPAAGYNLEYFSRGTASFDFQRSLVCIDPCICDQYLCHLFGRIGISVKLSTQCTTTCSSCTIRALVQSQRGDCLFEAFNPPLTRPFCHYFDGHMFDVKFLSCNGCPSLGTPTCGGQMP